MAKPNEQAEALKLRRLGFSYSEIQEKILVSKATLSLWLRGIRLSKVQEDRLAKKKLRGVEKGGQKRKDQRLAVIEALKKSATIDIAKLDKMVFWLSGAALYWAEGSKQKDHNVSVGVKFSNSDSRMINFFYKWLQVICKVSLNDITFEIYIHENANIKKAQLFWSKVLGVDTSKLLKVRLKKTTNNKYRKNQGKNYNGLIRINVSKSTNLNRKIMSWVEELYNQFK